MRYVRRLIAGSFFIAATLPSVSFAADDTTIAGTFSFTSTSICVDRIHVDGAYDEHMHTFRDSGGVATRLSFTGTVRILFTDMTTLATYRPDSSGPGTIDLQGGQTAIRGANGVVVDSSGNLVGADGRAVLDANGNAVSLVGHVVDVCAKLGTAPAP